MKNKTRRTSIVATLGPATDPPGMLESILREGVAVVRLNLSHGKPEDHLRRAREAHAAAAQLNREVGVLADLQGPKIRIEKFATGPVQLQPDAEFTLDCRADAPPGDATRVGVSYLGLPQDVKEGDRLLLDDGLVELEVREVEDAQILCKVVIGGTLSDRKGLNRKGGGLSLNALSDKDRADIKLAAQLRADFLAVSFVRCAADIEEARKLLREAGGNAWLVAKIERAEAIAALDEIVDAADGIMVARGDLGVEVGDAAVPGLQKRMIRMARARSKVVITATQLMESMISNPIPTRAEVSDVANAVLDGTDAVMLSAESAVGHYPLETVQAMHRVCLEAEKEYYSQPLNQRMAQETHRIDESIALAAIHTARHLKVKAIAALTQSGTSAQWLARADTIVPIYALSPEKVARRRLTLYRGVYAYPIDQAGKERDDILREMEGVLLRHNVVSDGDLVLLTFGEPIGTAGGTNTLKVVRIGEHRPPRL
jgi:pyruvate kinase